MTALEEYERHSVAQKAGPQSIWLTPQQVMRDADAAIAELQAEVERLTRQRDRAEQKYDSACAMMSNARGPDGWEVVEIDGEKSLVPHDYKAEIERLKNDLELAKQAVIEYVQMTDALEDEVERLREE